MRNYNEVLKEFNKRERRKEIKAFLIEAAWGVAFLIVIAVLLSMITK